MQEIDYLIVGSGIAGLCIAECLHSEHASILIINQPLSGEASIVSSGLINPITGKRFVKSWNYHEIEKTFLAFYSNLEDKLQIKFLSELQLIETLHSAEEENQWLSRTADPEYMDYMGVLTAEKIPGFRKEELTVYGRINKAYRVDVELLLSTWMDYFRKQECFREELFDYNEIQIKSNSIHYKAMRINKSIIFCEGYRLVHNPYFNWLPLFSLKGECLQFYCDHLLQDHIFKSPYAIVPKGKHRFWCGSNFELDQMELNCTNIEMENQLNFVKNLVEAPIEIINHAFGIRPAIKDRRPVLGKHPENSRLIVFGGLGTKGFSIAPYCAIALKDHLVHSKPLPKSTDIGRFLKKHYQNLS